MIEYTIGEEIVDLESAIEIISTIIESNKYMMSKGLKFSSEERKTAQKVLEEQEGYLKMLKDDLKKYEEMK